MHEILRPLRIRGFARLATAYTLNELADWLATITLAILVYDATRDPLATTALFVAAKFLPALAVPAIAARLEGRAVGRVLCRAYLGETAIFAALALTADSFWLPLVILLALLDGTVAASARAVTRAATVALLEPTGRLREGNALLNVGFSAMNVAGPAVAGGMVALLGAGPVLTVGAALFAVQAVVIGTARGLRQGEPEAAPWGARLREGFRHVAGDPQLRVLLGGQGIVFLLLTMITPIEVVYAKETLDAGDVGLGVLLASWGVGMVIGSSIFARERHRSLLVLIVLSTLAMALGYVGMALAPGIVVACAASVLGGMGNGVQWVGVVTAMQEATEERFQTRVAGLFEAVTTGAPGLGFLLGGLIATLLSPRAAFAVSGGGVLVVLLVGVVVLRGRVQLSTSVDEALEAA